MAESKQFRAEEVPGSRAFSARDPITHRRRRPKTVRPPPRTILRRARRKRREGSRTTSSRTESHSRRRKKGCSTRFLVSLGVARSLRTSQKTSRRLRCKTCHSGGRAREKEQSYEVFAPVCCLSRFPSRSGRTGATDAR